MQLVNVGDSSAPQSEKELRFAAAICFTVRLARQLQLREEAGANRINTAVV